MFATSKGHWVELGVFLILLIIVAWATAGRAGQSATGAVDDARFLGQADQVRAQLQVLHTKSSGYLEEAPRNYEDYFRDTRVVHQALLLEITALDEAFNRMIDATRSTSADGAAGSPVLAEPQQLALKTAWSGFQEKLKEQLGVDPEMPRLEWGFKHIIERGGNVTTAIDEAVASVQARVDASGPGAGAAGWTIPAVFAWSGLFALWFGVRVRPGR